MPTIRRPDFKRKAQSRTSRNHASPGVCADTVQKLTERQLAALEVVAQITRESGSPPTLRELCLHLGYSAIGSAQDIVGVLRKKGFLQQPERQSARSLLLTDLASQLLAKKFGSPGLDTWRGVSSSEMSYQIPFLGLVSAGLPIEAVARDQDTFSLPLGILPNREQQNLDKLFALIAKGDSMMGAGILEEDVLIVRSQEQARLDAIVVARLHDEVTVKRLCRDARGYFLKPENPRFRPIYAADAEFQITGEVVALVRRF